MKTPVFEDFLKGKVSPFGLGESFGNAANLPDLSRFDEAELKEFREFIKERHHQDEWEAFFQYVALPPWKRNLSRIAGVVISVLGI